VNEIQVEAERVVRIKVNHRAQVDVPSIDLSGNKSSPVCSLRLSDVGDINVEEG